MKNYFKIVLSYLKKYISRSTAICLSIVLCIALMVGVGTLSKSARQANIDKVKYEEGNFHVKYKDLSKEQLEIVSKYKDIKEIGISSYYDSNTPDGDLIINLSKINEEYIKSGNSKIVSGKFPTKSNEIAIEEWVLSNMGMDSKIGEKITISLFNKGKKETYKVVGILKDRTREKASGVMEVFLAYNSSNKSKVDAYITFDENSDIKNNIKNIAKEANIKNKDVRRNSMLLESLGEKGNIDYSVIIISIIVAIVSGTVIYGIFNISMFQRISEYGIIRAIGGDSLQVFNLVLCELMVISAIGIPIGIGIGLIGAKIFSSIAGGLFTEGTVNISKLTLHFDVLLFSVIVTLLIIFIIALITFVDIRKISLIDAIRKNISSDNISKRQILSISLLTKIIIFSKAVSFKNVFRNKKSFSMIILSMSLGSTIFTVSTFYAYLVEHQDKKVSEISNINADYKVSIIPTRSMNYGISNADIDKIKDLDEVESVKAMKLLYSRMVLKKHEIAELKYFEQKNSHEYTKNVLNGILTEDKNTGEFILKNIVYGYDDTLLKGLNKYLLEGEININKMKNEDIALIKIPHPIGPNVVDIGVGDKVKVTFRVDGQSGEDYLRMEDKGGKYIKKEFIIGGIVDELTDSSDYYTGNDSADLVISADIFEKVTGFKNYQIVNIDKKLGVNHNELNSKILNITNKKEGSVLYDFTQEKLDIKLLEKNKLIFIYSITVILFIISLFNIINNVSYSLISRTNEFGMIRAIGITSKEFKQMIVFEGLTYGIISSVFSVILSIVGQVCLFKFLSPELISPKFILQWKNYFLIVGINIIIGFIATYVPLRKIKDLSIVESISSLE